MNAKEPVILYAIAEIVDGLRTILGVNRTVTGLFFSAVSLPPATFFLRGIIKMQMTDVQQAVATVEAQDAEGNPAALDNAPAWSSSDVNIVTVTPAPDGMSAVIKSPSPGPLGSAVVTVTAQVAGQPVTATLAVDIVASAATQLNISTAPPTP